MLIPPHGGALINRFQSHFELNRITGCVELDSFSLSQLECLAIGAFSPLTGFMTNEEYENVLNKMRLINGLVWTIPITLPVDETSLNTIKPGSYAKLIYKGEIYGVIFIKEIYTVDKLKEVMGIYGTTDAKHPGVRKLLDQPNRYAAGPVYMIKKPSRETPKSHFLTPAESRNYFETKGWKTIVGFQTRNPIHRAHEYIQKTALETVDGLFIHPIAGETKHDDIPFDIRMESYQALINHYYSKEHTLLSAYPAPMWYAGPREAVLHAIVRKNYGCSHFIVGRDHAGVGNYYGTYDSQLIFHRFTQEEVGIIPLFFEHTFFCKKCSSMSSTKTCPHEMGDRVILSGTKVREMLKKGIKPPAEFSRPEVIEILIKHMKGKA